MRAIIWRSGFGVRFQGSIWVCLKGNTKGLFWGGSPFRGGRSGDLTLFAAGADGVHVPQRLHEGSVNLELPAGSRQVLGATRMWQSETIAGVGESPSVRGQKSRVDTRKRDGRQSHHRSQIRK